MISGIPKKRVRRCSFFFCVLFILTPFAGAFFAAASVTVFAVSLQEHPDFLCRSTRLKSVHAAVNTALFHELVMISVFCDFPLLEHEDLIRVPEGCDPVHCSIVYVLIDEDKVVVNATEVKIEN